MLKAMGTYIERYVYDAVGNFLQLQHRGSDPAHAGWTRAYDYVEVSQVEDGTPLKASNRLSRTILSPNGTNPQVEPYEHDAHGNMVRMPHLGSGLPGPNMQWDYKEQLRQVDRGGGGAAYYVYDSTGQRVRKVWEKSPGLTHERIYLDGYEVFRKHRGAIGADIATLERETLHVMDDKQPIALVETRTLDAAGDDLAPPQLIRFQFGNHLGSIGLELDEQAQIISYEEYAPYGSSTYQATRSQTEAAKRYRHTGKERDEESGLYYHGARYYAPWIARWTSTDPAGLKDSASLFVYVANDPVRHSDPTGGALWDTVKGKVASAVDRAEAAVKPGGVVFEAVDSAFKKDAHPVAAAVLNNMAQRGQELVEGVHQDLKKTAGDLADIAYYSTHSSEPGATEKLKTAVLSRAEAPLKTVGGAAVGFGQLVKRVGEAGGDIAYYSLSTEGLLDDLNHQTT